ncbi:MAG: tRNA lysidine(34) synthetase TilS [Smithellaceae bacterium]
MMLKIRKFIEENRLLARGDKVVVALSGGADSCALLLSLIALEPDYGLSLIAAHFNHGVRAGESDEDEDFCRKMAEKHSLPFFVAACDHRLRRKGMSDEEFYRHERYRFLDSVAKDRGAQKIAMGHHQNDQAETVLMHLLRGSGLEGLRGFLPMREGRYIRPLMNVSRQEIHTFLQGAKVSFREDSSNKNSIYLRNRLRLDLMPYLREHYNPAIESSLAQMAGILRREDEFIHACAIDAMDALGMKRSRGQLHFSAAAFSTLPTALKYRVVKMMLEDLSDDKNGFSFRHIDAVVRLATSGETGKSLSLPMGNHARRQYDQVCIGKEKSQEIRHYEYPVTIPGNIALSGMNTSVTFWTGAKDDVDLSRNRICLDLDQLVMPLVLRNRREADWIRPLGMSGRKKIKSIFIDRKIPRHQRDDILLLADGESVVWIEGLCISDRVKISPATKRVLVLEKQ